MREPKPTRRGHEGGAPGFIGRAGLQPTRYGLYKRKKVGGLLGFMVMTYGLTVPPLAALQLVPMPPLLV